MGSAVEQKLAESEQGPTGKPIEKARLLSSSSKDSVNQEPSGPNEAQH